LRIIPWFVCAVLIDDLLHLNPHGERRQLWRTVRRASGLVSAPSTDDGRPSEDNLKPSAVVLELSVAGAKAFEKGSG
jgi:hypothetical protein